MLFVCCGDIAFSMPASRLGTYLYIYGSVQMFALENCLPFYVTKHIMELLQTFIKMVSLCKWFF